MLEHLRKLLAAALFLTVPGTPNAAGTGAAHGPSLIGIDHIPTVVSDLEAARETYRRIGFSLKPGRPHDNGLRNSHVKFPDGSGIELLSVPVPPTDDLTASYGELLRAGEGPAYLSFHARDTEALAAALAAAEIPFADVEGLISLEDPCLDFIFFVSDNRSPTDRPEHFAHANGAVAMSEVWLALDAAASDCLRRLLLALGASESREVVSAPTNTSAQVFAVQNGRVIVLAADHQLISGREVIGARFRVREGGGAAATTVEPAAAHGLWLMFR
jgi:catechol 2,3-dioxygenase-like lactoylglutathione lyase family enzyme